MTKKTGIIGLFSIVSVLALGILMPTKASAQTEFVIETREERQALVEYTGDDSNVVIPDGVEVIYYNAFENNKTIETVTMPDSVIEIGNYAFSGCTNLKSIELSENLNRIWTGAFMNCKSLKRLNINKNLRYLDAYSIMNCDSLEKVTVAKGNKYFTTKKGALYSKNMKILYLYPAARKGTTNFTVPKSVEWIESYAFEGNKYLKTITVKGTVDAGGECAFSNCKSLTKLEFKKPYKGGFMADNCKKLKTVILAEGTTRIMANQFEGCTSLKKFNLPSGMEQIEAYAFSGCKNLKNIKFPDSIKKIGKKAFKGCKKLKKVSVPPTAKVAKNAF